MTRRTLLAAAPAALTAQTIPDRGPVLDAAQVKEFVVAGHGDLEKTRSMVDRTPSLVYAAWDWGGGDFETALGGASHMGRRDIALLLLERGARMDLFAAAMLGQLDIIKAAVTALPSTAKALGPHKIPLLAHARKGGPEAEPVTAFLASLPELAAPRV